MSFLPEYTLSVLIGCAAVLIYVLLKKKFNYFAERGLKSTALTWTDIYQSFASNTFNQLSTEMYDRHKDKGSSYVGFFNEFCIPTILVLDPALAERILIKDFSYFQDHGFSVDLEMNPIEAHLFNLRGDEWRTLRHKLVPTFTSSKLKGMVPIMEECADDLIKEIKKDSSLRKDTNLKELFKKYSLSVIASSAFGIDPESIKDPNCHFRKVLQEVVDPSKWRIMLCVFLPKIAKMFNIKAFPQDAEDLMLSITKDSFEMRKKSGVKRNDFIQLLLELKEKGSVELDVKDLEGDEKESLAALQSNPSSAKLEFTDKLLMAQVFSFFLAGFENIAFVISLMSHVLSKHPEVQTRVREEVKQVISKYGGINYQALRDMKLLQASIDEALRLFPPLYVMVRECTKPYTLNDGKVIDKGTPIFIPARALQTDDKYWSSQEEYNPDRFLNGETIHPGTYLPFGDGPRICIAQRLAFIMAKLMLVKLLLNFELQPSPKTKEPLNIIILIGADNEGGFWGSFKDLDN